MSVYIGSDSGVLRIGAHRCGRYASRAACLGATDPYCGWDDARDKCTEAVLYLQDVNFVQTTDHCPLLDMPGKNILQNSQSRKQFIHKLTSARDFTGVEREPEKLFCCTWLWIFEKPFFIEQHFSISNKD